MTDPEHPVQPHPAGATITFVVTPRAKKTGLESVEHGALRVRLTAPPVDGAANSALIDYLAKLLKTPKSAVTILRGQTSRRKQVLVTGLSVDEVKTRLQTVLANIP